MRSFGACAGSWMPKALIASFASAESGTKCIAKRLRCVTTGA